MELKEFSKKYRSEYIPRLELYLKNLKEAYYSSALGSGILVSGIAGHLFGLNAYNIFISCVGLGTMGLSLYFRNHYDKKFEKLYSSLEEKIDTFRKGGVVEDD